MRVLDDGVNVPDRAGAPTAPPAPITEPVVAPTTPAERNSDTWGMVEEPAAAEDLDRLVAGLTISEVLEAVRRGALNPQRVVASERRGKARYGILDRLA